MRDYLTLSIAVMVTSAAYLLSVIVNHKVILPVLIAGTVTLLVAAIITYFKK